MTDKVDLSLDEIIKLNRKQNSKNPRNTKVANSKIKPKTQPRKPSHLKQQTQQILKQDVGQTMLHVANLHFRVSDKDLKELFDDVAPTKKAAIHYDKSGRSLGTAEVIYRTRDAAVRAIKKYNNRVLDGRPMNITIVPKGNATQNIIGVKPGSGIHKRSQQPNTRRPQQQQQQGQNRSPRKGKNLPTRGGPRAAGKRQPRKEVTAEQLDADLQNYRDEKSSTMVVD